jgi:hypothetical protein
MTQSTGPGVPGRRYKFIGCEIIYREACALASRCPHRVDVEFLRKGLHDLQTADMVARIQQAVDAASAEEDCDAVLLGYARCNDGLVGVRARGVPLVIPRAHDCITLFFGSRRAYREEFDAHPGTYYMTTGWAERNVDDREQPLPAYGQAGVMAKLGLTESFEEMVAKYGRENAEYIVETLGGWEQLYDRLLYIEMGVGNEAACIELARRRAEDRGWRFEKRPGDWTLLEKLFGGRWDEDFVIVRPGERIAARNDERILEAVPAEPDTEKNP